MRYLILFLTVIFLPIASASAQDTDSGPQTAIFAAGCFWCIEKDIEKVSGVISVTSGYTGGHLENPTYKQVGTQQTGHYEAVKIIYDPQKVSYSQLLDVFWRNHDLFDKKGQFCDKGASYRAAVFALDEGQRKLAEESKIEVQKKFSQNIVTPILDAAPFYNAEGYHQDYYKKNPIRYNYYRWNCGRDNRLEEIWN